MQSYLMVSFSNSESPALSGGRRERWLTIFSGTSSKVSRGFQAHEDHPRSDGGTSHIIREPSGVIACNIHRNRPSETLRTRCWPNSQLAKSSLLCLCYWLLRQADKGELMCSCRWQIAAII